MKNRRSFIVGLNSFSLSKKEKLFLSKYKPWGVILFSRNIKNLIQTKKLTNNIRSIFKDKNYPILIDEEGGRISRLKKIINNSLFTGNFFGKMFVKDKKKFDLYYKVFIENTSLILHKIGVNINTVPVLDVERKNSNNVIGDRSFGSNLKNISKIGDICISNFSKNRIGTVIKHIPGHGLSKVDSHLATPIVKKTLKYLKKVDFIPFKKKKKFFCYDSSYNIQEY